MRATTQRRGRRTARVQREARRNCRRYHLAGPLGWARNLLLAVVGGERLLRRYDWLYGWRTCRRKALTAACAAPLAPDEG